MMCEHLHSLLTELAVTFLEHRVNADKNNRGCQNEILSICSTFAELDSLVHQLQDIYPVLALNELSTTLVAWTSSIHELLSKVKDIPAVNTSCSQDIQSAHNIRCLSVQIVTIKIQECAEAFRVKLEQLKSHLKPSLSQEHKCANQRLSSIKIHIICD